jgi:hypothetical protein
MTSFFYVVSIAFHTSVAALRKCMDTYTKKNSFGWTAATRVPLLRLFVGPERLHELPKSLIHLP